MLFELRELENPPWTLVRRQKDPKTSLHVNSRDEDKTISSVEPQTSINSGTWKRVDFTVDSGSAASCIPADMVNKSTMEPRLVGPTEHISTQSPGSGFGKDSSVGAMPKWCLWSCWVEGLGRTQETHLLDQPFVQSWI